MSSVPNRTNGGLPRRVLHFVSTFAVKTDTKWLVQLARQVDPSRYEFSVACFYDDGPIREQLESLGVRTFNLQSPGEHDPRAILRAKGVIQQVQPDVVHTHLLRADLFAGSAARWAGVPVIVSTVYAVGQYRRSKRRRSDRLLDLACAALPTHILAVSGAVRNDLIDRIELEASDITVIHTGIEPPANADSSLRDGAIRERTILTLARLSYEKGVDTLIDAAAVLHRTHSAARFVVVGDGPDRRELEGRIRARGLDGIVRLMGFTDDVWPYLNACDVVAVPSKSEGMPNALLEAMAAGKPIVATTVGGIPEAIAHRENGLLVRPESPSELAAAIGELLDDATFAERLGSSARRTVEERFHVRDIAVRYMDLYDRLLTTTKGERAHALRDE